MRTSNMVSNLFRDEIDMEFRNLKYFVVVAEERHFTRAAERLGMAQPPLSQQIRKLEREIGAQLFRRLTRGVELTDAGRVLYEDASRILDQVEQAKSRTTAYVASVR
jgi:DNA-binding transcriptional LysR family regulator